MLLVYGPRSPTYDFGPEHPLTPRRFAPAIDLLRAIGATPGLAPEPAPDDELRWCHDTAYIDVVRRFSDAPYGGPAAGIGEGGDDPPFAGMHDAAASVAGGSIRAMEAILRGDDVHAFHPGGGLHHSMPDRASGFCIYDDPALAIARARRDRLRVMYIDLDVHHGDGVQAMFWEDPGVLTVSFHETGVYLFPGSGFVDEVGEGTAAGTAVNVPLEPMTGEGAWLDAIRSLLPELAAAFGPDVIVSQHGADSHAWDPLAHLRMTTTAMGEAARLVDAIAHRHAGGRWLATGGGGYDAYRVVPRSWSLVWLAGAHRDAPIATPVEWRERWATEAARYGQAPPPATFDDAPNAGIPIDATQAASEAQSRETATLVRHLMVPRLLREGRDRGWWDPDAAADRGGSGGERDGGDAGGAAGGEPVVVPSVDAAAWSGCQLAARVVAHADANEGHRLIGAALADGAIVSAAVVGTRVVGLAVAGPATESGRRDLLALGVAPAYRRSGLAGALLLVTPADEVEITLSERDPVEPIDRATRAAIATRLLVRAGFGVSSVDGAARFADPLALRAAR